MDTEVPSARWSATDTLMALRMGKEFPTRDAASRFVRAFALSQGKYVIRDVKTRGGSNFTLRCDSETPCSFFVRIGRSRATDVSCFRLTAFNAKHDGCSGSAHTSVDQAKRFKSTVSAVTAQPSISAAALMSQIRSAEGVAISKHMAYRARDAVLEVSEGTYLRGFGVLESLLAAYSSKNGGAHTDVHFNEEGRFVRAFLSHPYASAHCVYGQRVVGIDGTIMKHGRYVSVMLIHVGRDGNDKNVLIGVGLCGGETSENADWFLSCCEKAGVDLSGIPVFSDRGKALLAAIGDRPKALNRFCTRHNIGT